MKELSHAHWRLVTHRRLSWAATIALAAGVMLALPLVAAPQRDGAYTGCGGATAPASDEAFETEVVALINQERAAHGNVPPLKRIDLLTAAARYHASDMGGDNYFDHHTFDRAGETLIFVCDAFDRVGRWYTDWRAVAENVGAGYVTPQSVVAGWMDSASHRRSLLNPDFTEIGVGYYRGGGQYGAYWVADLGVRRNVYPLIIAREAPVTQDRTVDVYIYGDWSEMRLRSDDAAWGDWQPFRRNLQYTLANRVGEQLVVAEVRSGEATAVMSDTIIVELPALDADSGSHLHYLPLVAGD
jgi:uncharacterized protein YkwD